MTVIISISAQSRASLAAAAGLTPRQCQAKLVSFFKKLGAARVLDLDAARDVALLETASDFVARYRSREPSQQPTRMHHRMAHICLMALSRATFACNHLDGTRSF